MRCRGPFSHASPRKSTRRTLSLVGFLPFKTAEDALENAMTVAEGSLAAYVGDTESPSFVCTATYAAGDAFGELALLYDTTRAATVRCTSRSALLYSLGRIPFRNLVS